MDLISDCDGWAGFVWHTAPLNDALIRQALCVKKPDPLAWFWVSFSICEISSLA